MANPVRSLSRTIVWIILILVLLGLGGYGVVNFSGRVTEVGRVGDKPIRVQDYVRAVQAEMRAFQAQTGAPITFEQARALGLDRQALARLVIQTAFEDEAHRLGISVGDERLRDQILQMPAFQGVDGKFDRDAYRFALRNAGLSEAEFEADLRDETARTILQTAILSGVRMPRAYADAIIAYIGERRSFTWAPLDESMLEAPLPEPTEEELRAFYEEHQDRFMRPETRAITYVWLTPEMLAKSLDVDEEALRKAYEERKNEYVRPERRLLERLVFASDADAADARARLDRGEIDFEGLVRERGLELADVDLGDVAADALAPEAREAVFGSEVGAVLGPLPSDLGPALYRVNGVLQAVNTTFEEARPELREELARSRAARAIASRIQPVEDLLAGGATLEEIADETELELGHIDWTEGRDEAIAAYDEFDEAARTTQPGDFPELRDLPDGGIFALRVDEVRPAEPIPFDEAREEVLAAWRAEALRKALEARGEELASQIGEGRTFEALGLAPRQETERLRSDFLAGAPRELLPTVFEMSPGEVRVIADDSGVWLVRLDAVLPADPGNEDVARAAEQIAEQASAGLAQDLFLALSADIQRRAGVEIDQTAINAVHAQFQ